MTRYLEAEPPLVTPESLGPDLVGRRVMWTGRDFRAVRGIIEELHHEPGKAVMRGYRRGLYVVSISRLTLEG